MHRKRAVLTVTAAGVLIVLIAVVLATSVGGAAEESPETTLANESLDLEAGPGQAIHGETNLQAGTELTLRVTLEDGPAFSHEQTVPVSHTGQFYTTLNLSSVSANTTAEIAVEHNGSVISREQTTIGPCRSACEMDGEQADREIALSGEEELAFETGPGRVVSGNASFPPGTELDVIIEQETNREFVTATVTADGTFDELVDLSLFESDSDGTVRVRWIGDELVELERQVAFTECQTACERATRVPEGDDQQSQFVGEFDQLSEFGETLLIPIDLHETSSAYVRVRSISASFDSLVRVEDGTGNDRVTVAFNTRPQSGEPMLFAAESGDTVSVEELSGIIGPNLLQLTLHPDEAGEETIETVRLELTEPADSEHEQRSDESADQNDGETARLLPLGLFVLASLCATAGIALLTGTLDVP